MSGKILLVDDEQEIADLIEVFLQNEQFQCFKYYTFQDAFSVIDSECFDLAIIDIMLPDGNGFTLCREIRKKYTYPIILLTSKTEGTDKVTGLSLGADDYVTKPFHISVFRKKVSALLGRIQKQTGGDCYTDGTLSINFSELTATLAGELVIFTPMEYRLLKVLVRNPQIVLTRQVLLEKLWDADENFVDEHALTVAISRVRGKIEVNGLQYIKTVYGMGYMWIGGMKK